MKMDIENIPPATIAIAAILQTAFNTNLSNERKMEIICQICKEWLVDKNGSK